VTVKVFAHRGSPVLWPENTLAAFDLAHAHGATGFETDLRLSADGEIVLSHDPTLDRLGHPGVSVEHSSAAELAERTIASPGGRHTGRVTSLRTLLEAHPDKDYILDCKVERRDLYLTLRDLLGELGFHDRIWFLTWSRASDRHVEEIFPGRLRFPRMRRSTLWGVASVAGLGRIAEPAGALLALPAFHAGLRVFDQGQIRSIRERGKTFMGYLVDTRLEWDHCVACGVERVLTNRPDLLARFARDAAAHRRHCGTTT